VCQNSPYSNLLREGQKVHLINPRDYVRESGTIVVKPVKRKKRKGKKSSRAT
jgi:hypothetical protein